MDTVHPYGYFFHTQRVDSGDNQKTIKTGQLFNNATFFTFSNFPANAAHSRIPSFLTQ